MPLETFIERHLGPRFSEVSEMLDAIGVQSMDELIEKTIPNDIRFKKELNISKGISETEYLRYIWKIAAANKVFRSYIGQGYYNTIMPSVIRRNILENPSWYTSYTPYQAEISQGRLEALLNFQTVITELTGMEIANASLLDEATAAAEAMIMLFNVRSRKQVKEDVNMFFIDEDLFEQTKAVLLTRAEPLGINLKVGKADNFEPNGYFFGAIVQYPTAEGIIKNYSNLVQKCHHEEVKVVFAADIMALSILNPPSHYGADVVVGSSQRFGLPMGYGGPHAGFFATSGGYKRHIPGRIIGITRDKDGKKAYRMALQTREQHIKRDRATSNICTAQALLATMSSMYAVFHGRQGLQRIARYIHTCAVKVEQQLVALGYEQINVNFFDTLKIRLPEGMISADIKEIALEKEINLRYIDDHTIGISVDEKDNRQSINDLIEVFAIARRKQFQKIVNMDDLISIEENFLRDDKFLDYEAFNKYRSETELMRYIKKLERKDFSLTHSMISLGSCTMKLNAATEMTSLSWPEFSDMHPFAPVDQAMGYHQLFYELGEMLKEITGLPGISFQPNSGAAGEYTGLLTIREYHKMQNELHRNIMLIPASAHGTNPASAVMAGFKVVVVKCDENGNIDLNDLKHKAGKYSHQLGGIMITYPSTHGVFESKVREMIEIVHNGGGQVYMDGANMNAQVGLTSPGIIGADVCHLNLHKTFSIPHGGGGPGVGPICVAEHLIEFLPTHPVVETGGVNGVNAVSSAPWGSASILAISHAYCKLLGRDGLKESTRFAILNANYLAAQLKSDYDILYTGETGYVGHEFIIDCRPYKNKYAISETDIAKRLMDYGFHAPTLSFPVHGTLMIEPTESESLQELDRFIEAMKGIVEEIKAVENGRLDKDDNPLKNAPHTAEKVISDDWPHLYSRTMAAYPKEWVKENKFWPAVLRVDDAYGDRNLHCTCAPISEHIND